MKRNREKYLANTLVGNDFGLFTHIHVIHGEARAITTNPDLINKRCPAEMPGGVYPIEDISEKQQYNCNAKGKTEIWVDVPPSFSTKGLETRFVLFWGPVLQTSTRVYLDFKIKETLKGILDKSYQNPDKSIVELIKEML